MKITGKVEHITLYDDRVTYEVTAPKKRYRVCSDGRQAVKDAVFLREGQRIEISGMPKGKLIIVKDAKIDISMPL